MRSFILEHENDDLHKLALKSDIYPHIDLQYALQQIKGRKVAKEKLPLWYATEGIIYPPHISLEQSSSEATASFKASLFKGKSLVDLTGGLGVDFSFFAKGFSTATYVEQQEHLVDLASQNIDALGLKNATVVHADANDYLQSMDSVDTIYIDPARRDSSGKKIFRIEDCTPSISEVEAILHQKAETIVIKYSPMLDITEALKSLQLVSDVYVVSLRNECKELLFVKKKGFVGETTYHSVNIIDSENISVFSFTKEQENNAQYSFATELATYLYEPNASILKAGAYKIIADRFQLKKLHPNSHLYTSEILTPDFQGRKFEVKSVIAFQKKELKEQLSKVDKANITVRNFPMGVDELRKRLKIKDGGNIYIFATTLVSEQKVLLMCEKIN